MAGVVAAYVRVSSKSQSVAMQKSTIERAANARGEPIATWYADRLTAASLDRPELRRLRADVRGGGVRRIYVYRLDRLARTGIRDTLEIVDEFGRYGCDLVTLADGFDLAGPAAEVVIAVLSWAAKLERQAINERIAAARARLEEGGGRWGRPRRMTNDQILNCIELAADGESIRAIARRLSVPRSTVAHCLTRYGGAEVSQKVPQNRSAKS